MATSDHHTVQVHILGWVPIDGLSECCLTPSLIRVTWAVSPSVIGSFVVCTDCQQQFQEEQP